MFPYMTTEDKNQMRNLDIELVLVYQLKGGSTVVTLQGRCDNNLHSLLMDLSWLHNVWCASVGFVYFLFWRSQAAILQKTNYVHHFCRVWWNVCPQSNALYVNILLKVLKIKLFFCEQYKNSPRVSPIDLVISSEKALNRKKIYSCPTNQ